MKAFISTIFVPKSTFFFFYKQQGMYKIENQGLVNLIGTSKLRLKMLLLLYGLLLSRNLKIFKANRAFTRAIQY